MCSACKLSILTGGKRLRRSSSLGFTVGER
jgi:hypothetical protein